MDRAFLGYSGNFHSPNPSLPKVDVVKSIREHLTQLLNARQGSLRHLPDYGLPDLGKIYQELPESLELLKHTVLKNIYYYEPRLKNSRIEIKPVHTGSSPETVIGLAIFSEICNSEEICFEANFLSSGIVILF